MQKRLRFVEGPNVQAPLLGRPNGVGHNYVANFDYSVVSAATCGCV